MVDWPNVLLGLIGGSGITGALTTIYDRHERSKEKSREYFQSKVLKREFFETLAGLMEGHDLAADLVTLKKDGGITRIIDGKRVYISKQEELLPEMLALRVKVESQVKALRESGVFFLLPTRIRESFQEVVNALPGDLSAIDETTLKNFRTKTMKLSTLLVKSLGIAELA